MELRKIVFRGKSERNGVWLYGDLEYNIQKDIARIHTYNKVGMYECQYIVDNETVGQFTGLYDKNGNEIYEGDIVAFDDTPYCVNGSKYQGVVVMYKGAWCVKHYEKCFDVDFYSPLFADDFANRKTIILGNIHDNPELLKGGEK